MPVALADGIETYYEVVGSGQPLLMYAPGGFDARLDKWRTQSIYAEISLLDELPSRFTCILFDRRESGASGGRVERLSWACYAAQGKALLDHLGHARAHVAGGCMGVSCALAFAVAYPETTASLVLWWPVGGARYRINAQLRFADHLAFVQRDGLRAVVDLAMRERKPFNADPRGGPWASILARDPAFAAAYAALDPERYAALVLAGERALFDRDTAPGAEPEALMGLDVPTLVVPGNDASHATSAARYLAECIPRAQYWDVPVAGQTRASAPARVLEFLTAVS